MKSISLLAGALALTVSAAAADWPQWRGPDRNGISLEKDWVATQGAAKELWSAQVGIGFSSFVVGQGKVYTTGHHDGQDTVYCFDAVKGDVLWKHAYPAELGDKYYEGGTIGTPTLAEGKLYHLSKWGDVFCFEAATGKVLWSKNVQTETGIRVPDWGYSGSPFIWEDLVILNVGEAGLALEKASGKIVWKSADKNAGYSTPYPFVQDGKTSLIIGSGRAYVAVNPRTGEKLWEHTWNTSYGVNAADPVVHDGLVLISSGYNKGAALLKPVPGGEPEVVWQNRNLRCQMNPPILINGYLYAIDGNAERDAALRCVEFSTGKVMWTEKAIGHGSVVAAGDRLIVLSESGELSFAPASPEGYAPDFQAQVLEGRCWTVPVLSQGLIYARNAAGKVVSLDFRKP